MICITGAERRIADVAGRIARHTAELHEIRIDALEEIDDTLWSLIERHGPQLIATCRPSDARSKAACQDLLLRAQTAGARYIDIEEDAGELKEFEHERRVLSFHDFSGLGGDLVGRAMAMRGRAAVVKIAVHVDDVADLERLREVRLAIDGPAVLIGMGAAGVLSRTHHRAFGSAWTYVAASAELATAPGQLDVDQARLYNMPCEGEFFALVGGPQVAHSPGPHVYNRLFRDRGLPFCYLALETRSLRASLPLLERIGAIGLSVTMPLKTEAARIAALDDERDVVNSLKRQHDGWHAINSDVAGVREPLRALGCRGRALILGSGGAARSAVEACEAIGLEVTVAARSAESAGFCRRLIGWNERADSACDVLVNATPIAGDDSPWPEGAALPQVVFDLAMASRSRLLEEAARQGRTTLTPLDMWVHQGAEQMSFLLDAAVSPAELRERLP